MSRSVYALGGLLILALVLSYVSWTSEGGRTPTGRVMLVDASEDTLELIRWVKKESRVDIASRKDAHGRWLEVTTATVSTNGHEPQNTKKAEETDAGEGSHEETAEESGGEEAAEDSEAGIDEDQEPAAVEPSDNGTGDSRGVDDEITFTGGTGARKIVDAVTPFLAKRRIENVPSDRLETMGLEGSQSRIEIVDRGRTHTFELGDRTYGGGNQYLRRPGESDVYLIEAGPFRALEHGARRLMQREVLDLSRGDIERLTVRSPDGRHVTMVQMNRGEPAHSYFADETDPDRRVDQYERWIGRILAFRADRYVREGEAPSLEPVVHLTFEVEGVKESVSLEVLKGVDESAEKSWFARSDHTRGMVSLSAEAASSIVADLGAILGG